MGSYHTQLIEQMIEQTPKAILGVIIVSVVYVVTYVKYIPIEYLMVWVFSQIIFLLFRYKNIKNLEKLIKNNETDEIPKHTRYFLISMVVSAILWNIAVILGLLFAPTPYEILTLLMVVGLITGSVLAVSSLYTVYIVYFIIMLFPQFFIMVSYGDRLHLSAAAFTLAYIPLMLMLTKSIYNNQVENILVKDSLQSSVEEFHTLSITDSLTDTYTRRYFFETAKSHITLAMCGTSPLSLLMIDIDYFKKVNDSYGHQAGDVVLASFAQELQALIREKDILARIGGEEFAILLHNTSKTVSIGTAELSKNITSMEMLCKAADDNLYVAKKNGRNRVN
ncbi:MAG: hypothetical protein COA92_07470 [Sulfurovum sp.]|nr:MAG: hypothetical protein COA92_07470 [Sulfurovum sp.]